MYFKFAVIYTIEFQKRRPPPAHVLVLLQTNYMCVSPNDIYKIIYVDVPDKDKDPHLFKVVFSLVVHGPCDPQNKKSMCMQNGKNIFQKNVLILPLLM